MATWYIVKLGAEVQNQTFNTYEGAEFFALGLAAATGEHWNVEKICGWDY